MDPRLSALQARFLSRGLVLHVVFPNEDVRALLLDKKFWDASVLRHDLPVALATDKAQDVRIGIAVLPSGRGCAYPTDKSNTSACNMSTLEYVRHYTQWGMQRTGDKRTFLPFASDYERLCCQRDWEAAFTAKAILASSNLRDIRNRFSQHNKVRVSWSPKGVVGVFYRAYYNETTENSVEALQACASARRLQSWLDSIWSNSLGVANASLNTSVFRLQLAGDRQTRACKARVCWSNIDINYVTRVKTRRIFQPVLPSEC